MKLPMAALMDLEPPACAIRTGRREGDRHACAFTDSPVHVIAISIEIQDKSPSESGKRSDYSVERQFRCQMASLVVSHL